MHKTLIYLSLPVLIVLLIVLYVNISFTKLKIELFYSGCPKVWGHRGHFKEHEMNSLASFRQAFDLGAAGVELDIHYDAASGRFIVSHGYPYALKEGRLLHLEDVFGDLGKRGYFWLDFKNLKDMKRDEARTSARKMRDLLERHGLQNRVIVESKDAINLAVFSGSGIYTSIWISPDPDMGPTMAWLKIFAQKAALVYGRFSAVSMNYRYYTPVVRESMGNIPVHLFTVNDQDLLRALILRPEVKVVLTDENYFTMEDCE